MLFSFMEMFIKVQEQTGDITYDRTLKPPDYMKQALENLNEHSYDTENMRGDTASVALHNPYIVEQNTAYGAATATENSSTLHENVEDKNLHSSIVGKMDTCEGEVFVEAPPRVKVSLQNTCKGPDAEENEMSQRDVQKDLTHEFEEAKNTCKGPDTETEVINEKKVHEEFPQSEHDVQSISELRGQKLSEASTMHLEDQNLETTVAVKDAEEKIVTEDSLCDKITAPEEMIVSKCESEVVEMASEENTETEVINEKKVHEEFPQSEHDVQSISELRGHKLAAASTMHLEDQNLETTVAVKDAEEKIVTEDSLCDKITAPEEMIVSKCESEVVEMESEENTETEVINEKKVHEEFPQSEHDVQSISELRGQKLAEASTMHLEDQNLETTVAVKDAEEKIVTEGSLCDKITAPEEMIVSKCESEVVEMESEENTETEAINEKKVHEEFPQSEHDVQSISELRGQKLAEASTMHLEDQNLETTVAVKDAEEKIVTEGSLCDKITAPEEMIVPKCESEVVEMESGENTETEAINEKKVHEEFPQSEHDVQSISELRGQKLAEASIMHLEDQNLGTTVAGKDAEEKIVTEDEQTNTKADTIPCKEAALQNEKIFVKKLEKETLASDAHYIETTGDKDHVEKVPMGGDTSDVNVTVVAEERIINEVDNDQLQISTSELDKKIQIELDPSEAIDNELSKEYDLADESLSTASVEQVPKGERSQTDALENDHPVENSGQMSDNLILETSVGSHSTEKDDALNEEKPVTENLENIGVENLVDKADERKLEKIIYLVPEAHNFQATEGRDKSEESKSTEIPSINIERLPVSEALGETRLPKNDIENDHFQNLSSLTSEEQHIGDDGRKIMEQNIDKEKVIETVNLSETSQNQDFMSCSIGEIWSQEKKLDVSSCVSSEEKILESKEEEKATEEGGTSSQISVNELTILPSSVEKTVQEDETISDKIEKTSTMTPDQTQSSRVTIVEAEARDGILDGEVQSSKAEEVSYLMAEEQIAEALAVRHNVDMEIPKYEPEVVPSNKISAEKNIQEQTTTHPRYKLEDEALKESGADKGKSDSSSAAKLTEKLHPLDEEKESEKIGEIPEVVHDEGRCCEIAPDLHDEEQYLEKVPELDMVINLITKCDMPNVSEDQVEEGLKKYEAENRTYSEKIERVSEDRHVQTVTDTEPYNDGSDKTYVDSLSGVEDSEQKKAPETGRNTNPEKENRDKEELVMYIEQSSQEDEKKYEIEKVTANLMQEYQSTTDDLSGKTEITNRKNENSDENVGDLLVAHKSAVETIEVGGQMHEDTINYVSGKPMHDVGNNMNQIKREPEAENLEKYSGSVSGIQSHKTITDIEVSDIDTLGDNKSIDKELVAFSTSEASMEENTNKATVLEEAAEKINSKINDDEGQDNTRAAIEVIDEEKFHERIEADRSMGCTVFIDEETDQATTARSLHVEQIEGERHDENNELKQGKESFEAPVDSEISLVETPADKTPDCILRKEKCEDKLTNNPDVYEKIIMDEVSAPTGEDVEERGYKKEEKNYQQKGEAGVSPEEAEVVSGIETEEKSYKADGENQEVEKTDFTTVAQNFEIVAETKHIKTKLSEDDESPTMKFDAKNDRSNDASSTHKENTNIIHLNEENENVNNKDEEIGDKKIDDLPVTSALADEAESISLHGDQRESTNKADDIGDKILNQEADSDLTSIELNLETRSATEPTSIEISENDNHNIVADNKESEAANSKDEGTINKSVDHSPVIPALVEFEEQIHEVISENDSISFGILKGENKTEKLESSYASVLEEEKCKGVTEAGVIDNDIKDGTLSASEESFEEKTNHTNFSSEGDEHSHEARETSKSKGGTLLEESKTIDRAAAAKSSMQSQAMEGDKLKQVYGLISEAKYRSFETENKQEEATSMEEGALAACHGIHSNMVSEEPAIVDEDESPGEQNLDEEEAVKDIDKEVGDSNLLSQKRFETTTGTRPTNVDDERDCNPTGDALSEKEASVEKNIQKHASAVVSEVHDVKEDRDTEERDISEYVNKEKQDVDVSLETEELEDEKQDEGNKIQPEHKVYETISINETNKKESSEEEKTYERGSENEKYEDVELENPVNELPEGLQTASANINRESLEKEGINDNLEECSQKDGDKILEKITTKLEPANQSNEPVLACYDTEGAIPQEEILESEYASEKVGNVDEINEENKSQTIDDLAVRNELVEEITNAQSSGYHLQIKNMEPETFGKAEEQFESISIEDEEKPEKNETWDANSQKDAKGVQLERHSNIVLDRVATAESSEKIENTIAEKDSIEAPDACVRDEVPHDQLHKDEIEAEKNNDPESKLKPETTDTTNESPNDVVNDFNCVPLEHDSLVTGLTEKVETESSMDEEDAKKNLDVSVITTSAQETIPEVGQKIVEVSDTMPGESAQVANSAATKDVEFTTEKNDAEGPTEVDKFEYNSTDSASIHATHNAYDTIVDVYVKGEEVRERTADVLLVTDNSGINTIDQEAGEKIGELSHLVSKEEVNERDNPSAEVTEDEKSNKVSILQEIEVGPPAEERERVQHIQETSHEVAELDESQNEEKRTDHDELPVSRLLLEHILRCEREMLAKTCNVDFQDKTKENGCKGRNDDVISNQETIFTSSVEQVTEDKGDHDVKENTEDAQDDNSSESNLYNSSPSPAVGEAMIPKQEEISVSFPAEQVNEETNISEDKTEGSMKLKNTSDLVKEQNLDAKDNTQRAVAKEDESPRSNLCESFPLLAAGEGVKDEVSGLQDEVVSHDITDDGKKMTATELSCTDSKVDTERFNYPVLKQDEKIHSTALDKKTAESAIQKDNESLDKFVDISSDIKASPEDILEKEGGTDGNVLLPDFEKIDIASYATSEEKTLPISDSVGNSESLLLCEEQLPNPRYNQTGKSFESSIIEDQKHKEELKTESEVHIVEYGEENQDRNSESQVQNLKNYSAEALNVSNSDKVQQSDLVLESTNENVKVTENFLEERNPAVSIEEKQIKEAADTQVEEEKTDEENDEKEGEDKHKTEESGHDATGIVQGREADSKPAHKKSHNILSGVGSKVKHSFSKVKKAITGKSSHTKTVSPK